MNSESTFPRVRLPVHSRPQRPRSFRSAPRIATSGLVQQRKSPIHGLTVFLRMLRVKSDKSDWLRVRNVYSAHSQKIGPSQRSRFLVLPKRRAASKDENAPTGVKLSFLFFKLVSSNHNEISKSENLFLLIENQGLPATLLAAPIFCPQ